MKRFRYIALLFAATLMTVSFNSCSKDDDETEKPAPGPQGNNDDDKLTVENYVEFLKNNAGLTITPTETMKAKAVSTFLYPYGVSFETSAAVSDGQVIAGQLFPQTAAKGGANYDCTLDDNYRLVRTEDIKTIDDALIASMNGFKQWQWYYDSQVEKNGSKTTVRCVVYIMADDSKNSLTLQVDYD